MNQLALYHGKDLRKGRASLSRQVYIITACTAGRAPLFAEFELAAVAAARFAPLCERNACRLLTWVLMPDHAHWVVQLGWGVSLARLVHGLKGSSARAVNRRRGAKGSVWQPGYHDRAVRAEQDLRAVCRYVVANPLRAGIAEDLRAYPFWDAIWL